MDKTNILLVNLEKIQQIADWENDSENLEIIVNNLSYIISLAKHAYNFRILSQGDYSHEFYLLTETIKNYEKNLL